MSDKPGLYGYGANGERRETEVLTPDGLADFRALIVIAEEAGVSIGQALQFIAALGELPAKQVVRMCGTACNARRRNAEAAVREGQR